MPDTLAAISSAASGFLEGDEPELALPLYLKAVTMATAAGARAELSGLLGDLAVTYRRLGDLPAAIATNRKAIEASRACRHDLNITRWSGNLGGLLLNSGDFDGAEVALREAVEAAARTGLPDQVSIAGGHWAAIMGQRGRYSEAVETMERAGAAAGSVDVAAIVRSQELDLFLRWVRSLREERRLREAREVIERALPLAAGTKPSVLLLLLLADVEETEGDIVAAAAAADRAADAAEALGDADEADTLRNLARRMRG